jgi:hypothetical protein
MLVVLVCTIFSVLISDPALSEVSGMVATSNALQVHNDSGDGPYLYNLAYDGQRMTPYQFADVKPIDVEAVALDGDTIYIGDVGRNGSREPVYTVYRWPNQNPLHFRFPSNAVHDIEAMIVINGTVMVITKQYRSELWTLGGFVMRKLGALIDSEGNHIHRVTDATRDGSTVLVRTYGSLHLFDWSSGVDLQAKRKLPAVGEQQGEAVALLGDTYWTMSEYSGQGYAFLHRYEGYLE